MHTTISQVRKEMRDMTSREGIHYPCAAFYSHDGFGLGHLSRTVHLANRLRELEPDVDIHIITSSPAAHRVQSLHDFAWIKLPSVTKCGVERYRPHHLSMDLESVVALRAALLLRTVQHLRPDLLVVDHRPLGLKKEASPALNWLKAWSPKTRTVVGLRDIVDEARTVKSDWREQGIYDALDTLFDAVLVYGDRSVLDTTQAYDMPDSIRRKTRFVGYLGRGPVAQSREAVRQSLSLQDERLVVVHAGGGGDGTHLIETYLQAANLLPRDVHSLVVTGPLMDPVEQRRLQASAYKATITFVEYQHDLPSYVAAADLSISMGGYNTVCEVLSCGVPSIIVPRMFPRQEQYIRAQLLASRGLIRMVPPHSLSAQKLAEAVLDALDTAPTLSIPVALDGSARAASYLASLLRTPTGVATRAYARR